MLHFVSKVVTFRVNVTFCVNCYIWRRNTARQRHSRKSSHSFKVRPFLTVKIQTKHLARATLIQLSDVRLNYYFRSLTRDCLATLLKGDMTAEISELQPGLYCLL